MGNIRVVLSVAALVYVVQAHPYLQDNFYGDAPVVDQYGPPLPPPNEYPSEPYGPALDYVDDDYSRSREYKDDYKKNEKPKCNQCKRLNKLILEHKYLNEFETPVDPQITYVTKDDGCRVAIVTCQSTPLFSYGFMVTDDTKNDYQDFFSSDVTFHGPHRDVISSGFHMSMEFKCNCDKKWEMIDINTGRVHHFTKVGCTQFDINKVSSIIKEVATPVRPGGEVNGKAVAADVPVGLNAVPETDPLTKSIGFMQLMSEKNGVQQLHGLKRAAKDASMTTVARNLQSQQGQLGGNPNSIFILSSPSIQSHQLIQAAAAVEPESASEEKREEEHEPIVARDGSAVQETLVASKNEATVIEQNAEKKSAPPEQKVEEKPKSSQTLKKKHPKKTSS